MLPYWVACKDVSPVSEGNRKEDSRLLLHPKVVHGFIMPIDRMSLRKFLYYLRSADCRDVCTAVSAACRMVAARAASRRVCRACRRRNSPVERRLRQFCIMKVRSTGGAEPSLSRDFRRYRSSPPCGNEHQARQCHHCRQVVVRTMRC